MNATVTTLNTGRLSRLIIGSGVYYQSDGHYMIVNEKENENEKKILIFIMSFSYVIQEDVNVVRSALFIYAYANSYPTQCLHSQK